MKGFVFLSVILIHHTFNDATPLLSRQKRVIGGFFSPDAMFPYMVSLRVNKFGFMQHFCGAVIISEKYILSSAHCMIYEESISAACYKGIYADFKNMKYKLVAIVGTNHPDSDTAIEYEIHSIMYHAEFNFKTGANDISLLLTKEDIKFSSTVQPVIFYNEEIPPESSVLVPGWGLTSFPGEPSTSLRHVNLRTISSEKCAESWSTIHESQMCTYKDHRGVCTSDSGGPLIYKGYLVGLVSFGKPCAVGWPDVFTNVTYLLPWIYLNKKCMDGQDIEDADEEDVWKSLNQESYH